MWHRFRLPVTTGSKLLKTCHEMGDASQIIGSESTMRRVSVSGLVAIPRNKTRTLVIAQPRQDSHGQDIAYVAASVKRSVFEDAQPSHGPASRHAEPLSRAWR
jgi:hypothetical protein